MPPQFSSSDHYERAVFHKAVLDLLKLDAEGCRIVKAVAAAVIAYDHWLPLGPTSEDDYDRAKIDEQCDAFHDLCQAMLGNCDLAYRLAWRRLGGSIRPRSKPRKPTMHAAQIAIAAAKCGQRPRWCASCRPMNLLRTDAEDLADGIAKVHTTRPP